MARCVVTVTFEDNGSVSVSGPLTEKVLCYGLLTEAMNVIRNYQVQKVVPAVVVPQGVNGSPSLRKLN